MMGAQKKKTPSFIRGIHTGESFDDFSADDVTGAETGELGTDQSFGDPPPPPPDNPDDPAARKLAAKRYNEGIKLIASSLNTVGLTIFLATIVQPLVTDAEKFVIEYRPVWYFVGVGLHIVAQAILRFEFRSEE